MNNIVAYDKPGATWKNSALLVAGANDSDNNFESYTAAVGAKKAVSRGYCDLVRA